MKSILPDEYVIEKQFNSRVDNFLSKHGIGKILHHSNFRKQKGFSCLHLFKFVFLLVFNGKNLYRTLQSSTGHGEPEKDTIFGNPVPARILFIRDRNRSKKWLALLTTDLELTDEEIIQIYGKRWDIEVFFKTTKSFLNLAKEFQGRSYDSMVAHTTIVFCRYIMLALEDRESKDPKTLGNLFYLCCDELQDLKFEEAFQIDWRYLRTTYVRFLQSLKAY